MNKINDAIFHKKKDINQFKVKRIDTFEHRIFIKFINNKN